MRYKRKAEAPPQEVLTPKKSNTYGKKQKHEG